MDRVSISRVTARYYRFSEGRHAARAIENVACLLHVTLCRAKGDVLIEVASFDGEETVSGKGKVARGARRLGRLGSCACAERMLRTDAAPNARFTDR